MHTLMLGSRNRYGEDFASLRSEEEMRNLLRHASIISFDIKLNKLNWTWSKEIWCRPSDGNQALDFVHRRHLLTKDVNILLRKLSLLFTHRWWGLWRKVIATYPKKNIFKITKFVIFNLLHRRQAFLQLNTTAYLSSVQLVILLTFLGQHEEWTVVKRVAISDNSSLQ